MPLVMPALGVPPPWSIGGLSCGLWSASPLPGHGYWGEPGLGGLARFGTAVGGCRWALGGLVGGYIGPYIH